MLLNEPPPPDDRSMDKWYYDLGALAGAVETNRKNSARGRHRIGVLAAFTLLCFIVLAFRTESNARDIERATQQEARNVYNQCLVSRGNAQSLNKTIDRLILSIRTVPGLSDADRADRLAVYTASKPVIPNCGPKPQ